MTEAKFNASLDALTAKKARLILKVAPLKAAYEEAERDYYGAEEDVAAVDDEE